MSHLGPSESEPQAVFSFHLCIRSSQIGTGGKDNPLLGFLSLIVAMATGANTVPIACTHALLLPVQPSLCLSFFLSLPLAHGNVKTLVFPSFYILENNLWWRGILSLFLSSGSVLLPRDLINPVIESESTLVSKLNTRKISSCLVLY